MKTGDVIQGGFYDGFQVIDTYSRAQALEDGVLVDVSKTAAEAGIRFPVAVTQAVWGYIVPSDHDKEKWGQDLDGRLWDTVWVLKTEIDRVADGVDTIHYEVRYRVTGRLCRVPLKAVVGAGDQGEPAITIMLPRED